jgi:uncharacterized cofD-like protein
MGGGTGLPTLLRGLKRRVCTSEEIFNHSIQLDTSFISNLTAIVGVTDDGGSSGRLRRDFDMLPPGDVRSCMVALAEDEHLLTRLFSHRFCAKGELAGHSFGNLFIAALVEMTGDFARSIKLASEVLAIQGHILPVTTASATLAATMEDGSFIRGETKICDSCHRIVAVKLEPVGVTAFTEALQAIAAADLITLGPGSLYTSLITNLCVGGISDALAHTRAVRVYIANLMTEANESIGLTASEHIERIYEHAGGPIFDYALVNIGPVSAALRKRYASERAEPVAADIERIEAMGIHCITGDLIAMGDHLRHAADSVTDALLALPSGRVQAGPPPVSSGNPSVYSTNYAHCQIK